MRTLRHHVYFLLAIIGLISSGLALIALTGFLLGALTPQGITGMLASSANTVAASKGTWWLASLLGWVILGWTGWLLFTFRAEYPVLIKEDEFGAVEVAPEALAKLARAEVIAQGSPKPIKCEFARKLGRPVLQVWCDLTCGDNGEGPVARGMKLKGDIEKRLREDFSLDRIRVEIIHQPRQNVRTRSNPATA